MEMTNRKPYSIDMVQVGNLTWNHKDHVIELDHNGQGWFCTIAKNGEFLHRTRHHRWNMHAALKNAQKYINKHGDD